MSWAFAPPGSIRLLPMRSGWVGPCSGSSPRRGISGWSRESLSERASSVCTLIFQHDRAIPSHPRILACGRRSQCPPPTSPMRTLLCTTVLLFASASTSAQPARAPVSPIISALRDAVSKRTPNAESVFWTRIQRDGAPIVEAIPGDTANVLLTFVWRGDSATRNVTLVNSGVGGDVPAEALLARIPGTDVWCRSYPARADARFIYELSVNDNLVPFDEVTDWGARSATFRREDRKSTRLNSS